jgi:NAD(P)-dependent dehydrogenase (short-subunit alcohol dehydrogenase family)
MHRTILVTEGDSPLGAALARLLLARGHAVAIAETRSDAGRAARGAGSAPGGRGSLALSWNRRSPISAHTLVRDVLNAFGDLDEVLVLEPPCAAPALLLDTSSADIERGLDDAAGPAFLARESLGHFKRRGSGVLAMVSMGTAGSALEHMTRECFRGLASALLLPAAIGPGTNSIMVNGFQAGSVELEEYAAFIDRTLEEKARKISGRWFSCQPRGALFQAVLSGQPRKG